MEGHCERCGMFDVGELVSGDFVCDDCLAEYEEAYPDEMLVFA